MYPEFLYNITFKENAYSTVLKPYIPYTAGDDEDRVTKRICLCPTIEQCLSAIGPCSRDMHTGVHFVSRRVLVKDLNANSIYTPQYLSSSKRVPDAMATQEYWCCEEVTVVRKVYKVLSFQFERVINWACLTPQQVLNAAVKFVSANRLPAGASPLKVYKCALAILESQEDYDAVDDLYDAIADLPWAQGVHFTDLEIEEVR